MRTTFRAMIIAASLSVLGVGLAQQSTTTATAATRSVVHHHQVTVHHKTPGGCRWRGRNFPDLPAPLVQWQGGPWRVPACDPLHRLPRQAQVMFACVRWHEGGDNPAEYNGAGMYQYTDQTTWDEFKLPGYPSEPSAATGWQQDVVAYRTYRTEQFLPWNGDPCIGQIHWVGPIDGTRAALGWY